MKDAIKKYKKAVTEAKKVFTQEQDRIEALQALNELKKRESVKNSFCECFGLNEGDTITYQEVEHTIKKIGVHHFKVGLTLSRPNAFKEKKEVLTVITEEKFINSLKK